MLIETLEKSKTKQASPSMADSEAMLDLKVKTLLPATYEVRASAEVRS